MIIDTSLRRYVAACDAKLEPARARARRFFIICAVLGLGLFVDLPGKAGIAALVLAFTIGVIRLILAPSRFRLESQPAGWPMQDSVLGHLANDRDVPDAAKVEIADRIVRGEAVNLRYLMTLDARMQVAEAIASPGYQRMLRYAPPRRDAIDAGSAA